MSSRISGLAGKFSLSSAQNFEKRMLSLPRHSQYRPEFKNLKAPDVVFCWAGTDARHVAETERFMVVMDGLPLGWESSKSQWLRALADGNYSWIDQCRGDFSIAIYDKKDHSLTLIRDRLGLKPLYYFIDPKGEFLAFGSQPYLLFSSPGFDFGLCKEFVGLFAGSHYRTIDNAVEDSPFSQIKQLEPGHKVTWSMSKGLNKSRYWNLYETPPSDENALDFEKSALKYRELLAEAVMARYKSAAAPVFTLSGGLDSSSVMASVVSQTGQKQIAYSSVYSDATYDESDEIKSMLDQCVSNWNAINIEPKNIFDSVSEMVRIHNEPVATATWLSHYLLAGKISADKYTTVFGGLGGDELNAGEYEYFFYYFADLKRNGEDKNLDHEIKMWAQHHDHPIFKKNKDVAARGWTLLTDQKIPGKCLADRARIDRYRATVNQNYFDVASFDPVMDKVFNSYLKNRTYHDLFRETMPCCVRAEDRHGAYFGLENSLPFLDHKLVEFMFSMPSSWKIKNGVTKILLREAMKGVLPEETRARIKKMGWNAPAHVWFSKSFFGELFDLVHSETFMRRGLYEAAEVQRLLSEHRAIVEGRESTDNHMMFFWQLLNMELWLRWVDEERKNAPLFEQS